MSTIGTILDNKNENGVGQGGAKLTINAVINYHSAHFVHPEL
jgi:hypothetical protein